MDYTKRVQLRKNFYFIIILLLRTPTNILWTDTCVRVSTEILINNRIKKKTKKK